VTSAAPPATEFLSLVGVTKSYGSVVALDDVSFAIRKGEIFGYIGPNGAGKTTTIKVIVGLVRDFTGTVHLEGRPIARRSSNVQRMLGYLPQKAAFQDWRTVSQALSTFGRLSGMSRDQLRERIPRVLTELGIPYTQDRKIVQLSGGTVQKVGLAQAILHQPPLLILDEPMSGLDPESRFQFKGILKGLRDQGTTIFFSSHILRDVQDIADRFGILDRGRILHVGTFEQLQARLVVPKDIAIELSYDSGQPLGPVLLSKLRGLDRVGPKRLVAHLPPDADVDATITLLIDGFRGAGCVIRSIHPMIPDLEETYVRFLGEGGA